MAQLIDEDSLRSMCGELVEKEFVLKLDGLNIIGYVCHFFVVDGIVFQYVKSSDGLWMNSLGNTSTVYGMIDKIVTVYKQYNKYLDYVVRWDIDCAIDIKRIVKHFDAMGATSLNIGYGKIGRSINEERIFMNDHFYYSKWYHGITDMSSYQQKKQPIEYITVTFKLFDRTLGG